MPLLVSSRSVAQSSTNSMTIAQAVGFAWVEDAEAGVVAALFEVERSRAAGVGLDGDRLTVGRVPDDHLAEAAAGRDPD